MERDRTELEWKYEPRDFFEAPYQYAESDFELRIESGRAIAILTTPADLETQRTIFCEEHFLSQAAPGTSQLHLGRSDDLEIFIGP